MWSSHSYMKQGRVAGHSDIVLRNAVNQTESVLDSNPNLPSILTLKHLSARTCVGIEQLRLLISREFESPYLKFSIAKRSGGRRYINVPAPNLSHVQRWIHQHILSHVSVHRSSYAFVKSKSIKDCAMQHCGATWLIKLDITNFFESISEIQVFNVFNSLGYQPLVAFELARLCTVASSVNSPRKGFNNWKVLKKYRAIDGYEQKLLGYLPQGAPSSPLLSNLVMAGSDQSLSKIAREHGLIYTRYCDDLTFSTNSKDFCREKAVNFIRLVSRVLSKQGFYLRFQKTKIIPIGAKKVVLGLNVDGDEPRLQKEFKDRIRQHLYYLKKFGPTNHVLSRGFDSVWGFKSHLRGMIDYASHIEPRYGQGLVSKFDEISWPC